MSKNSIIVVDRFHESPEGTLSRIFVNEEFICFGLELPWMDNQRSISCVPSGQYLCKYEHSPAFSMNLVEMKGVPKRSECKFHVANYLRQLKGCVGVGMGIGVDSNGEFRTFDSKGALSLFHEAVGVDRNPSISVIIT